MGGGSKEMHATCKNRLNIERGGFVPLDGMGENIRLFMGVGGKGRIDPEQGEGGRGELIEGKG